jgi:hypothetical protein
MTDELDRDALKASAVELGIEHPKNISTEKLAALVLGDDRPVVSRGADADEETEALIAAADAPREPEPAPAPPAAKPAHPLLLDGKPCEWAATVDVGSRHIRIAAKPGSERDARAALDTAKVTLLGEDGAAAYHVASAACTRPELSPCALTLVVRETIR